MRPYPRARVARPARTLAVAAPPVTAVIAASTTTGTADDPAPERIPANDTTSPTEPSGCSSTETWVPSGCPHASSPATTGPVSVMTDTVSRPPFTQLAVPVTTASAADPVLGPAGAVASDHPAASNAPAVPASRTRAPVVS